MYNRILITVAAVLIAAFMPLRAQPNVSILTVDTLVYLGKTENREAKGAFFLPDGNIIAVWGDTPLIIDSKSGEILRRLDSLKGKSVADPKLTPDGTKLVTRIMGPRLAVWDIPSGKIIKQTTEITSRFCLSKDGTKVYVTETTNGQSQGIISVLDINTLERIDRFCKNNFESAGHIAISPDGQTLAVSVYRKEIHEWDTKTNQVILIDLNNPSKYTVIEELEPSVYSLEFSPDGKQIAFMYNGGNYNNYIYLYSTENKGKKYITLQDLSTLFGIKFIGIGTQLFVDNSTIIFAVGNDKKEQTFLLTWNIFENRIKNLMNYNSIRSLDSRDSTTMLCNQSGVIGLINKKVLPVIDSKLPIENYLLFSNNQLEYNSDKSFIGQSIIYDTTGKVIVNLGTQTFNVGKNTIRVNQPLMKGVYILTIKNGTEQISKKFLVEN